MKHKRIQPENPPQVNSKLFIQLGRVGAALMAVMALVQLFRFDKFLPALDAQLPGGYEFAIFVGVLVVLAEVFSIPFLLRLRLSRLARLTSGLLLILPAWIWLMIAIWSVGTGATAIQFSSYTPLTADAWLIVFNVLWLAFNFVLAWKLGLGAIKIGRDKKLKKPKH